MVIIINNTIVWGFDSESIKEAIKQLNDKDIINIKVWVGNNSESNCNIFDIILGEFNKEKYYNELPTIYNEIFHKTFYIYMDMMVRHSFHPEKLTHENLNIYNMLFDLLSHLLIKHEIKTVLFSNIPHEGPDYILYQIAKKLDLNVIVLYQSIFPGRFFYIHDINDFGTFKNSKLINSDIISSLKIENAFEKNLSYMDNVTKHKYGMFSLQRNKNIISSSIRCLFRQRNIDRIKEYIQKKSTIQYTNKNDELNLFKNVVNVQSTILDISKQIINYSTRIIQRYINYKISRKELKNTLQTPILHTNYIYFPLNLQPELTTCSLGNEYSDQLLAIERLSKIIPERWFIYVKDNPKQTELMRSKWFYKRLNVLNNVKLVPSTCNTYILLEYSEIVATITGTAGWEAITGGKNTILFGNAWYKSLPGVFNFKNLINSQSIIKASINKIDHKQLEHEFNLLLQKTYEGIIDGDYINLSKDFNHKTNSNNIYNSLKLIIEESS